MTPVGASPPLLLAVAALLSSVAAAASQLRAASVPSVAPAIARRMPAPPPVSPFDASTGAYTGPFTQLNFTLDVSDPEDGFGAEDKLVSCVSANTTVVFIDLDEVGGVQLAYNNATTSWTQSPLVMLNSCASGNPLYPRVIGYVVGTTVNPITKNDRLVILGGSTADSNVFYSDDCGVSWTCSSQQQAWIAREYAVVLHTDIFQGGADTLIMAGGVTLLESIAEFHSTDGGITWSRPACAAPSPCMNDCKNFPLGSECTLPIPDPVGSCSSGNFQLCYLLPDVPAFPGSMAADWSTLWYWLEPDEDGMVWGLNSAQLSTGWSLSPYVWGGYGRKVFIRGPTFGSGCWFSTDFSAEDLWCVLCSPRIHLPGHLSDTLIFHATPPMRSSSAQDR